MTHQDGGVKVGARVRVKADGRTGVIRDVHEAGGRTLYDVEFDRSPEETSGFAVRDFAVVGTSADAFDVLRSGRAPAYRAPPHLLRRGRPPRRDGSGGPGARSAGFRAADGR